MRKRRSLIIHSLPKEELAWKVIESLENCFSSKHGTDKVPLSYDTVPSAEAPNGDDGPGFGKCNSMIDEAIQRSQHCGEDFADGNKMVESLGSPAMEEQDGLGSRSARTASVDAGCSVT